MALSTIYITVPFLTGADGSLHPDRPCRTTSRTRALASAEALARFFEGVIVLRDCSDSAANVFLEPALICVIGDVPRELLMRLAA